MSSDPIDQAVALASEHLSIAKATVVTDLLRMSTVVQERPVTVESTIGRRDLLVERVTVERPVAAAPEPREQGDTLIISTGEERLVRDKRLFVVAVATAIPSPAMRRREDNSRIAGPSWSPPANNFAVPVNLLHNQGDYQ